MASFQMPAGHRIQCWDRLLPIILGLIVHAGCLLLMAGRIITGEAVGIVGVVVVLRTRGRRVVDVVAIAGIRRRTPPDQNQAVPL